MKVNAAIKIFRLPKHHDVEDQITFYSMISEKYILQVLHKIYIVGDH